MPTGLHYEFTGGMITRSVFEIRWVSSITGVPPSELVRCEGLSIFAFSGRSLTLSAVIFLSETLKFTQGLHLEMGDVNQIPYKRPYVRQEECSGGFGI
jgi:hypothetical protein